MATAARSSKFESPPTNAPRPGPLAHVPALDALRGLAILAVVSFHVHDGANQPLVAGGFLGVDAFFVLSGFLITALLVDEHRATGTIALRAFWGRRFARIVPLVACLLGLAALTVVRPVTGLHPPSPLGFLSAGTFTANWVAVAGAPDLYQLQFLWSVAIEVQFYVVWPLVVLLVLGRAGPDGVVAVALGLAAAIVILRPTAFADTDYFFHTALRADGLLLGAALGASRHRWQHRVGAGASTGLVTVGGATAVGVLLLAVDGRSAVPTWQLPLFALGVAAVVVGCVAAPAGRGARTVGRPALVRLGLVSYALYLVHLPVFDLVEVRLPIGERTGLRIVIEVALALGAAVLAHRLVERPAERWLRPGRARRRASPG